MQAPNRIYLYTAKTPRIMKHTLFIRKTHAAETRPAALIATRTHRRPAKKSAPLD
jgi:hypothetical protein